MLLQVSEYLRLKALIVRCIACTSKVFHVTLVFRTRKLASKTHG